MNVEIISHNEVTGEARIKFSHLDVVHEDYYDLSLVIPGSKRLLAQLDMEFTKELQLKALEKLTAWITRDIEAGVLTNKLEGKHPDEAVQPEAAVQPEVQL
jgi:hypothetical protein